MWKQDESGRVHTPLGDLPLSDHLRRRVEERGRGTRDVVVGIRPEDFEDAGIVGDKPGHSFEAPIDIVESMGSEIYAYFGYTEEAAVQAEELRELEEDAGAGEVKGLAEGARAVARLDATSDARPGRTTRLWVDTDKIHLFDAADGISLTYEEPARAAEPSEARA